MDHDLDGMITPANNDVKTAAAFVRNTKANVTVILELPQASNTNSATELEIRGTGSDGITFPAKVVTRMGNAYTYTGKAATAFRNEVHHYDDFTVSWQVRIPNGGWVNAGTSATDVYLLLAAPIGNVALQHTYVHMGSHFAMGQTTQDGVIIGVWDYFTELGVRQQDEVPFIGDTAVPGFGREIAYWKKYEGAYFDAPAPFNGSCNCGAMTTLFLEVLRVQGIVQANSRVYYTADFFVNAWEPTGAQVQSNMGLVDIIQYDLLGEDPDGVFSKFNENRTGYNIREDSQLKDAAGVAGQNSPNPLADFPNHNWAQLTIAGEVRWLDPSYGVEYVGMTETERKNNFEDTSVYGFKTYGVVDLELAMQRDLDGDGEITGDADLTDLIWFDAVRRQIPGLVEGSFGY